MKAHIGPIYLILGLMATSALAIGAAQAPSGKSLDQARKTLATAKAQLPSPASFRFELARAAGKAGHRVLVVQSGNFDAELELRVAKALAEARGRKSI